MITLKKSCELLFKNKNDTLGKIKIKIKKYKINSELLSKNLKNTK